MKILITTHQLSRGGKEKQLIILAKGLLDQKYDVEIVSTKNLNKNNYYQEYEFPINRINCLGDKNYLTGFKKFKKEVSIFNPDIIITFDIQSTLWSIWLQKFRKTPFINHSIQRGTPYEGKEQWILKYVAKRSKINIANSKAGLNILGLKQNDTNHIIYSPIDLKISEESINFKSIFGFEKPNGSRLIVNMGSISEHKGQHTIIEALMLLKNKDIYALFLGEGQNRIVLEKNIENSWINKNIKFLGQVDHVEKYLRISDLYVHASKGEGSSNAILEALAAELPVITTLNGGTKEIAEVVKINAFEYGNKHSLVMQLRRFIKGEIKTSNLDKLKMRYLDRDNYVNAFIKIINSIMS